MLRYWWPGYEQKFLGKLQRQQNNSQFCDTLLQSDGISIPTHGCILAAFSPYLSERLLASPTPPFGQKRHLDLHMVKAQTLLKLVALIYSGEVEVNVGVEQNDLLAAAIKFGITDLVEGQKQAGVEERCCQGGNCQSFSDSCKAQKGVQDTHVQAEMVGRREFESPLRAASCAPAGAAGKTASAQDQEEGPSEYMPAHDVDCCLTSTPQNLNNEDISNTLCSGRIPSSGLASDDDDCELNCSFNSTTNCTTLWSVNMATTSFYSDSNSRSHQGVSDHFQSPALTDMIESEFEDQDAVLNGVEESGASAEQPKSAQVPEVERVKCTKERKNLIKQMAQMAESTQISIKVKLVRTQGEVWEVAHMQNTLSSLKQTTLHSDSESSSLQSSPASKPETPTVQPAAADASEPPLLPPSTATAPQLVHNPALIQNERPCSEESYEQMEVRLEDIIMGMNIPPSEERSCRNPALLQVRQDSVQVACPAQAPVEQQSRRDTHAAAGDAGPVFHQDYRAQVGLCSTDTDQTQSSSFSPSSLQHEAPESMVSQRESTSPTNTVTTESQSCSFAGSPTLRAVTPAKSVCGDVSTQDREDILQFLPPAGGNSERSLSSLSTIDNLHLPHFLSPLRPVASVGKPRHLFQGAKPGRYRTHSNLRPPGRRLPTEIPETQMWTSTQTHTNVKSRRNTKTRVGGEGGAVQLASKKRRLCRPEEAYVWQVRDGMQTEIHLSACSVSLSSNNVLAKERKLAVSSSGKSKGTQNASTESSKIQTRGFLKKIQEASCQTKAKDSFVSKALACLSDAVDNGEAAPLKRKRGRPFSKRGRPKQNVTGASDAVSREQQSDHNMPLGDGAGIKTKRKRRRKTRVAEAVQHKRTRGAGRAEAGGNRDVALATKRNSCKFAQRPKSTVTRVNGNEGQGTNEPERHEESSNHTLIEEKDTVENQDVLTPAQDENSNPVENCEGNSCSFTGDEVSLRCDKLPVDELPVDELPVDELPVDELPVDELLVDELHVEELPVDELNVDELNVDELLAAQCSPQPHQVPFKRPSQHELVDVEGEEEEEIEVVLYSPVPQLGACENILDNMDMLEAGKEERGDGDDDEGDLSEIDVTGDEAE